MRIKGIDPDEFLNQNADHGDDDDEGDDNHSECSECSCESCCAENCRDENVSSDNQTTTTTTEKSDEASALVDIKKKEPSHKSKTETQHLTSQNIKLNDEQTKKTEKIRNNNVSNSLQHFVFIFFY